MDGSLLIRQSPGIAAPKPLLKKPIVSQLISRAKKRTWIGQMTPNFSSVERKNEFNRILNYCISRGVKAILRDKNWKHFRYGLRLLEKTINKTPSNAQFLKNYALHIIAASINEHAIDENRLQSTNYSKTYKKNVSGLQDVDSMLRIIFRNLKTYQETEIGAQKYKDIYNPPFQAPNLDYLNLASSENPYDAEDFNPYLMQDMKQVDPQQVAAEAKIDAIIEDLFRIYQTEWGEKEKFILSHSLLELSKWYGLNISFPQNNPNTQLENVLDALEFKLKATNNDLFRGVTIASMLKTLYPIIKIDFIVEKEPKGQELESNLKDIVKHQGPAANEKFPKTSDLKTIQNHLNLEFKNDSVVQAHLAKLKL